MGEHAETACGETNAVQSLPLGTRLSAAAALIRPGCVVADIGCDHGKLAVYLVKSGKSPRVIAIDARPLPLARAVALAEQCKVSEWVDCRLGDGFAPLLPGEAQEILIAGLSGETICDILQGVDWLFSHKTQLVLQPTSRAPFLRRYLCKAGFSIEEEQPVLENNRAYTNLRVLAGGQACEPTALFCEVGKLQEAKDKTAAARLLQSRLIDLENQLAAPLSKGRREEIEGLIREVSLCLQWMKSPVL